MALSCQGKEVRHMGSGNKQLSDASVVFYTGRTIICKVGDEMDG